MVIEPVFLQCLFILGLDWIEGKNAPTFIWLSVLLMLLGAVVAAYNDLEGEIRSRDGVLLMRKKRIPTRNPFARLRVLDAAQQ